MSHQTDCPIALKLPAYSILVQWKREKTTELAEKVQSGNN